MVTLKNSKVQFVENFNSVMIKVVDRLENLESSGRISAKDLGEEFATENVSAGLITSAITQMVSNSTTFASKVGRAGGIVRVAASSMLVDSEDESSSILDEDDSVKSVAV